MSTLNSLLKMAVKATLLVCFVITFLSCVGKSSFKLKSSDSTVQQVDSDNRTLQQDSLILLLPTMKSGSLDCHADIYWKIIKRGKVSIPSLIESLSDTTITNVYDSCKHGKLNVGEVSYFALEEIAEFPAMLVTHIQFDVVGEDDCWNFYNYLFDNQNKALYQKMASEFYSSHQFQYKKFDKKELNKCFKEYGIEGKYVLQNNP